MKLKLPRTYKLVLSLALVAGPFTWLMFTQDGQRRSDLFLLHVMGSPSFNIAYDRLTPQVREADIAAQFPKLEFDCRDASGAFGERVCAAEIASFNGLPAREARLFYTDDLLSAVQLYYRERYHGMLEESLRTGLGEPLRGDGGGGALAWQLEGGVVLLSGQPPEYPPDAVLLWLSPAVATLRDTP